MTPSFRHDGYSIESQFKRMAVAQTALSAFLRGLITVAEARRIVIDQGFVPDFRRHRAGTTTLSVADSLAGGEIVVLVGDN